MFREGDVVEIVTVEGKTVIGAFIEREFVGCDGDQSVFRVVLDCGTYLAWDDNTFVVVEHGRN